MNVFISHARNDLSLAKDLSEFLEKYGFDVFLPSDSIQAGENIEQRIQSAIEMCNAMIVILNPNSYHSKWVKMEVELALTNEKYKNRLLPVFVGKEDENESSEIPWFLKTIKRVNLKRRPNGKFDFSEVNKVLKSIRREEIIK